MDDKPWPLAGGTKRRPGGYHGPDGPSINRTGFAECEERESSTLPTRRTLFSFATDCSFNRDFPIPLN
jgi:hypothetical protein